MMTDALDGLRKALEAEHAAVYAYGVVGARTGGDRRRTAASAFDAHRARRDRLRELIIARGGTPAEPAAGYTLPFPVTTAEDCVRLAALVEERVTAAYLELVAVDDPAVRRMAALAMQESTTRAYAWRPDIPAFPGWK
ncbi:ferritin-like domain-containing protein [Thermopolyspora sp. NPDC052614]|uniref:ferritin-like domain-containing protein n=1 Tax=Thermopolyspora sp. NPDC052614 TaxID=3155682 RepID=UPI003440C1B4